MRTKYTPGPWYYTDCTISFVIQDGKLYNDHNILCYDTVIIKENTITKEVAEANARLMSSAPELLEALEDILNAADNEEYCNAVYEAVHVINKAKGVE